MEDTGMIEKLRRRPCASVFFAITVVTVFAAQIVPQGVSQGMFLRGSDAGQMKRQRGFVDRSRGWPVRSWSRRIVDDEGGFKSEFRCWTVTGLMIDAFLSAWLLGMTFYWFRAPQSETRVFQLSRLELMAITFAIAVAVVLWNSDLWIYDSLTDRFNGRQYLPVSLPVPIKLPLYFAIGLCIFVTFHLIFRLYLGLARRMEQAVSG